MMMNSRLFWGFALAVTMSFSCSGVPVGDSGQWEPAGDRIMTEWASQVDPDNVLPEYPRPQMVREEWQNLNGLWSYAITPAESARPAEFEGQILVPFAVESALSGVGRTLTENDALWYSREFSVPKKWKGSRIMLNFGAVDWKTEVYVDGKLAGEHVGGYDPFSFDITDLLSKGKKHNITVKVLDQTDKWYQPRGKQIMEPHGIWYTPVSGIWQTVWMEPVPETYIKSFTTVPDVPGAKLAVDVKVENMQPGDICRVQMYDGEFLAGEGNGYKDAVWVTNPKLWSPENPFLYDLKVMIIRKGQIVDEITGYAAMREVSVARDADGHKRMLLNGEPLFQYGPLDQGWWPDGLYTAPTDEALAFDIEKTKEFGFNMIRKHVKVEPARWYYHCDRLGMLVWQDMPSTTHGDNEWGNHEYDTGTDSKITQEGKDNYYNEWKEIINDFKIFPSIVVWVPFNEAWGQFDTDEVVKFTREQDPSRLVNYASGGNFVKCSGDILDLHNYPDPEMYLYDPAYINVLGEYGGIGWPVEGHLWQKDRNWGYVQYQSGDQVLDVYESYAEELIDLIRKGFSAAVYTQTTDVEGEVNGLMTYDRKVVKLDVDRLSKINRTVIESL
jgi:beta-galactosidase/beta-glucuronidase